MQKLRPRCIDPRPTEKYSYQRGSNAAHCMRQAHCAIRGNSCKKRELKKNREDGVEGQGGGGWEEAALRKDAKTVGGLEEGQRRTVADERRIKEQDDRMTSGAASSIWDF